MRTDIDVRTPAGLRVTGIATGPGTPDTPLLVCLPGGSYTARYFDVPGFSLLDVAEANGFTAIALDRPGYGGSDPLPADERTFARNAEVLDQAIAGLWADYGPGHPGVVMISHSIGSAITVRIAAGQPAWPLLGITLPIWFGIGGMILGVIIMLISRPYFKEFFSRKTETAPPGVLDQPPPTEPTPARVDF